MSITHDGVPEVTAANNRQGPGQGNWTYQAYATLPDDGERYEVVDGVLFMAPSPGRWHQETVGEIFAYVRDYVKSNAHGKVYLAPFDVELVPNTVVQPDIIVILTANCGKITDNRIIGTPDLIVEVASPGTASYDRHEKQEAYARAGVIEYWIVDPAIHSVEILLLSGGRYCSQGICQGEDRLPSQILPNFPILVEQFFP